jgi:hypothetical protein
MKMLQRLTAGAAMTLSLGAVAFGQHYTETKLVSNKSGVLRPVLVHSRNNGVAPTQVHTHEFHLVDGDSTSGLAPDGSVRFRRHPESGSTTGACFSSERGLSFLMYFRSASGRSRSI